MYEEILKSNINELNEIINVGASLKTSVSQITNEGIPYLLNYVHKKYENRYLGLLCVILYSDKKYLSSLLEDKQIEINWNKDDISIACLTGIHNRFQGNAESANFSFFIKKIAADGANINAVNKFGYTMLQMALNKNIAHQIKTSLKHGAELKEEDYLKYSKNLLHAFRINESINYNSFEKLLEKHRSTEFQFKR